MKKSIISLFFCLFFYNGVEYYSFAQSRYQNVLIGSQEEPNEVSIAFHPFDFQNMVVGANIDTYYYTFNGGLNWTQGKMTSSYGVWGDPCVLADTKGIFYFFHLSNSYEKGYYYDRLVCQKSYDGGITWTDGTFMGANSPHLQDKEWAAIDLSYSPYRNNIYVSWTQCGQSNYYGEEGVTNTPNDDDSSVIFLSYSTDDGESWSERIRLSNTAGNVCSYAEQTVLGAAPHIGLNGEVYVAWASLGGIILDRSTDGGKTWRDDDIKVSDMPNGFRFDIHGIYRCFSFPSLACDYSYGPSRGALYICWADQRKGLDNTDIYVAKSTDEGLTWSKPVQVNDDTGFRQQFFSWMTIDQSTGYLYVVFYDRRNYEDEHTDVYLGVSKDGGMTFTNERISESPFFPLSSTFMGDYINIAASNGVVRPVWTRTDSTQTSVWTAIIDN